MPTSPCGPHVPRIGIRHLQAQGPHAQIRQASIGASLPSGDRTNLRTVGGVDAELQDAQGGAQWKRQDVANLPRAIFHGASTPRAYQVCHGGALISDPTPERLDAARSGIDGARLAPPRSKPDHWGEIHCPSSVVLTYEAGDPINAAAALRDVELRRRAPGAESATTPLFHTPRASRTPTTSSTLCCERPSPTSMTRLRPASTRGTPIAQAWLRLSMQRESTTP